MAAKPLSALPVRAQVFGEVHAAEHHLDLGAEDLVGVAHRLVPGLV